MGCIVNPETKGIDMLLFDQCSVGDAAPPKKSIEGS